MSDDPKMGGMLKQLRTMQKELIKAQKELAKETVSAEAGDGAVRITVSGDQRVTNLEIDPDHIEISDTKKLSRLLQEAFNQALEDSRQLAQKRLGPLSGGLNF